LYTVKVVHYLLVNSNQLQVASSLESASITCNRSNNY